jgi:hypothetical protein
VNLPTTKTITSAAISVPTTLYYFDAKSSNVGKSCEIGINSDSQLNNIN